MHVSFTIIGLISAIESPTPVFNENDPESPTKLATWNKVEHLHHGCNLMGLSYVLFDMYNGYTGSLWEKLDKSIIPRILDLRNTPSLSTYNFK